MAIGAFGTIVLSLFGYVYWATTSYVANRFDRTLAAEATFFQRTYFRGGRMALVAAIDARIAESALDHSIYLLTDRAFVRLAGNIDRWPSALADAQGWGNFSIGAAGSSDHKENYRATFRTLPDGSHLLVGSNTQSLEPFATEIDAALAFALVLIALLAAVVSILVTRRTVGRIESINATSRAIMDRGLDERIALRGVNDEWDELAKNLNSMLDRIQTLMREVKEVTDNIAHDLRTPLARMRGRLERASETSRQAAHDQQLIDDLIADLDDVLRLFSSLMRISQIEAAGRMAGFAVVDLAAIAHDVVELFDAAAEERGIRLSAKSDRHVVLNGDRDLLFDAIANLVDNAIKHGNKGGIVSVTVMTKDDHVVVAVADDGPGVPKKESQQIFKRFYRLERSRCAPGNGLGLSLVAAVAHLHRARIELADNQPGSVFRLVIPRAAAMASPNSTQ